MAKEIELTNGLAAIVDDDNYLRLAKYSWFCHQGYARRCLYLNGRQKHLTMHSEIIECPPGFRRDHKNGNRLDNRRENLRVVTSLQNAQNAGLSAANTCGLKGVTWHKKNRIYRAQIQIDKKKKMLGSFKCKFEAALIYDVTAKKHFGKFARLNFP